MLLEDSRINVVLIIDRSIIIVLKLSKLNKVTEILIELGLKFLNNRIIINTAIIMWMLILYFDKGIEREINRNFIKC